MKKCILLLVGAFLIIYGANATDITTHFTANTTLTAANSPYIIINDININDGVTVTIEEGVEIKFNSGRYLQVFGTLNAYGAKFTANSSTDKGSWDGIYVSSAGSGYMGNVTLDSCVVEYAGNIYCRKGNLTLKKSTIDNFSGYGVQVYAQGTLNIEETTIKNCNYPIYFNGPGILNNMNNNVLMGNVNDYIYFYFRDITGTFYMPDLAIPYYVPNHNMQVTETGNLLISAGVDFIFGNSREITIRGKIKALGTSENPITFDMHPEASNWNGINIMDGSIDTACIFQNCIFKNAKSDYYEYYAAVEINTASPTFENCKFMDNCRNLNVYGISKPIFTNCTFNPSTILNAEAYNIGIDMNVNIDFSTDSIYFNNKEIRAIKILPNTTVISAANLKKMSFKNLNNPTFCLYETTTILDTASLVIDPGIVIKCRQYNAMITANGTLTGIGTEEEPIIFTHIADDNFGNPLDSENNGQAALSNSNSGRIALYGNSTSKIKNWKINYGGYNSNNWAVYISKGNIVENCEIKNSYRGIYFYDNAQLLNNSFSNIDYYPVGRNVNQGSPVFLGNSLSNVGYIGIYITGIVNDSPTLKSMNFAGFTNVAYIVDNTQTIAADNVLTVDPGVVIKFHQNGEFVVNGALNAVGKANNKVIFTSIKDDSVAGDSNNNGTADVPASGDWYGIDFTGTASDTDNILKNCEFRYSGSYHWDYTNSVIRVTDCHVEMDSIKINFSDRCALGIFGSANPLITNSEFYNLANAPVYMDLFSNPTFNGNKIANIPKIGLLLRGQTISGKVPIRSFVGYDTITYITEETLTVTDHLIIPSGLTFKGIGKWDIKGKLDVEGTIEKPVVFTTQEDDMFGNPRDMQQNGNTTPSNNGNYFVFYDESDDLSTIDHALFRYSKTIPVQTNNASPKILNTTFQNIAFEGISLAGSSAPTIKVCTFDNITYPFRTSLVTYPAETSGNSITGTTGRAIRVTNETLTQDATLVKKDFAGITNIPYVFENYTVGTAAKLTISPGVICKFKDNGYINIYNGLIAKGGGTVDSTIIFTSDRDDFYGGDTYADGDANPPSLDYWNGIYFYNEAIDDNCILQNCIFKYGSYYYYYGSASSYRGAITVSNASPTIKGCLFEKDYFGIISFNTSLPSITNCDFVGSEPNSGYAIWNQTSTNTVTAKDCWWNHNTGPKNPTNNPDGQGERVSDYVDFTPWATQLAKPVLGDVSMNGEVKPYDASLVLQHAVSVIVLTEKQQGVADVSGNEMISSYDASLILQYSVGLISKFDPEPDGTKSASVSEFVSISFPSLINEPIKKSFEIPLTVSTFEDIKALDMKYSINQDHVKFLGINKDKFPEGITIETGVNTKNGEVAIAMASAYDLALNEQQIVLEFEFVGTGITESLFSLNAVMANDNYLTDMGFATIIGKSTTTGIGDLSQISEPIIIVDHDGIHAQFNLSKSNQDLFIQVFDLTGRTLYRKIVKNLNQGMQDIIMSYSDFEKPGRGICILNLKTEDFSLSKKLLLK